MVQRPDQGSDGLRFVRARLRALRNAHGRRGGQPGGPAAVPQPPHRLGPP